MSLILIIIISYFFNLLLYFESIEILHELADFISELIKSGIMILRVDKDMLYAIYNIGYDRGASWNQCKRKALECGSDRPGPLVLTFINRVHSPKTIKNMKKFVIIFILGFITFSFGASAQIKVASNGYVGIITSTPAYKLDINSGESRSWYSTAQPLGINHWGSDPRLTSGNKIVFYKTDASGYIDLECRTMYQYSDKNAKDNITPLAETKTLDSRKNIDKIVKLQGVNYTWKDDADKKLQVGFLAQDVEKVIPEAVMKNDSTQIETMSYTAIIPYLVEAIKEQQAQIEELKKKLNQ